MNAVLATEATKEFQSFSSWQSVRKLANEIGVKFYSAQSSAYDISNGMGLEWNRFWNDRIDVRGYTRTYGDNDYMRSTVYKFERENFELKIQLWAVKNNVEVVIVKDKHNGANFIQIVKKAN